LPGGTDPDIIAPRPLIYESMGGHRRSVLESKFLLTMRFQRALMYRENSNILWRNKVLSEREERCCSQVGGDGEV
jgi:hypothetical protein